MTEPSASELQDLKNLGQVSAGWLRAAGVRSPEELRKIGAIEAWHRVRERCEGVKVNLLLLYALEGALRDVLWARLPLEIKRELKASVR